jgi:hypothetical protein
VPKAHRLIADQDALGGDMASVQTIRGSRGQAVQIVRSWPAALRVAVERGGVPAPVRQCDGTYRWPLWNPETGKWELGDMFNDGKVVVGATLAECGDPDCEALHQDTVEALRRAEARKAAREAKRSQKAS